jgi:hypothetical protein
MYIKNQTNKLCGPQSASELYCLSNRHLWMKFSANFLWINVCRVVSAADPLRSLISVEPLLFFQVAPHLLSQGLSGPRSRPTTTQKIW